MARAWPHPLNSDLACQNIGDMLWTVLESANRRIDEEKARRVALQKEVSTMAKQIDNLKAMYQESVNGNP